MATPIDGSIEAEYTDGYIHNETNLGDISPYDKTRNVFNDILEKRPEAEHGPMVRFSLFYKDARYDVGWELIADNARPIRFKHMERQMEGGEWISDAYITKVEFGYQWNDADGKNHQEILEL